MTTSVGTDGALRAPVLLALVLGLVALAYQGVLRADFVWDDHPLIDEQPFTQEIRPLAEYFDREFWSDPLKPDSRGFYRPLVSLSYALEWQLWDGHPGGFHFTNLLFHLATCALLFGLVRRAGAGPLAAALATLLFGLHPRLTESVAWISGRTDVLASFFVLGALCLHQPGPGNAARRWAAGALLLLGLLCKEVAIAGVLAILAAEWKRGRQGWRTLAGATAPALLALGAWALLRVSADAPPFTPPTPFPLWQRLTVFPLETLGRYVAMLVDPLRPRIQIGVIGLPEPRFVALGAAIAVPALAGLLVLAWRRAGPTFLQLLVLAVVPIGLVLHVVPLAMNVVAADRFLYLPLASLAIGLAAASRLLPRRLGPIAAGAAAAGAVLFGITTARHVGVWSDDVSLWRFAVAHTPDNNPLPHAQLGHALAWHGRPEEAVAAYRESLRITREHRVPGRPGGGANAQANLALALSEIGAFDEAQALLEQVARWRPRVPIHHLQLAAVYSRALRFDDAVTSLESARAQVPDHPLVPQLLEQVHKTRARWEALPREAPGEPVEIVAERAAVMAMAGRIRAADALYARVLEDPTAPPLLVQRAAVHLAYGGYRPDAARLAFERLRGLGANPARVEQLEIVLAERRLLE